MDSQLGQTTSINGVFVDFAGQRLYDAAGRDIALRPQAFEVLKHLIENAGRLVSKDELMQAVWRGVHVTDDSLVQCVGDIRRALNDKNQSVLKVVPKRGYMLVVPPPQTPAPPGRGLLKMALLALCLALIAAGGFWYRHGGDSAASGRLPAVAVLPFQSIGGDAATKRLADGLTEEIVTDLARFPEFEVMASNSTARYRDTAVDPRQVGAELQVGFVVEGSIQREAARVRIVAQLIDAANGKHLWSDRWDRPDQDVFAVQAEIAEQVANRLGGGAGLVQETGRNAARRKLPENLSAYELYLLGTEKLEQFNKKDNDESIRLLERAVELDPGLARAWVELFHANCIASGFGADMQMSMRRADEAAERAAALDPGDAEAHAVLAMSFANRGNFARAKVEFDTALRLAPNAAEILIFYIGWTASFGESERAPELIARAIKLDPNYPMWAAGPFAYAYFMAGHYEEALGMLGRQTIDNYNRDKFTVHAGSLAVLGRTDEARHWVALALKAHPDLTIEFRLNEPGYNDAERQHFEKTMRLAGFPACATLETLAEISGNPRRLPECSP